MKILIAIPYTKFIEPQCLQSVYALSKRAGMQIEVRAYAKYSAAMARNIAVKDAIDSGFDYIFFVDSDQILPQNALIKLFSLGADMAFGWTMMAVGSPDTNIAIYYPEQKHFGFHTVDTLPGEIFEADGCGLALNLIKLDVFKDMQYPYFRYIEYENGTTLSEDLNFCLSLKSTGKKLICDSSVKAGHIKQIVLDESNYANKIVCREQVTGIPKKIHWCWLSDDPVPEPISGIMKTWADKCPDYEIVLWDRNKFPPGKCAFADEAIARGKWAMACDYIRLYAVYTEGGIYMDSDVILYSSFDKFLHHRFFTAVEYFKEAAESRKADDLLTPDGLLKDSRRRPFTRHIGLQAALFGAEKGHPFLRDCMERYNSCSDTAAEAMLGGILLAPFVYADAAYDYGFRYRDEYQELGAGMAVYPHDVFAGFHDQVTPRSCALHVCAGSWRQYGV